MTFRAVGCTLNDMQRTAFSQKLIDIRHKLELTQEKLGKYAGVTGSYINRIEKKGIIPSLDWACQLEAVLKLKERELSNLIILEAYKRAGFQSAPVTQPSPAAVEISNNPVKAGGFQIVVNVDFEVRQKAFDQRPS